MAVVFGDMFLSVNYKGEIVMRMLSILFILIPILGISQKAGYINIVSEGSTIRIMGEDSQGNRTGGDPRTGVKVYEIPYMTYGRVGMENYLDDGQPDYVAWEWGFKSRISTDFEETFKISFIGAKKGHYKIHIGISQNLNKGISKELEGEIDSLEALEYEMFFTTDTTKDVYFKAIDSSPSNELNIHSIIPSSVFAGYPSFTLMVYGHGFVEGSIIHFDNENKQTDFVSDSLLQTEVAEEDVSSPETIDIMVKNPDNTISNTVYLIIKSPPDPFVPVAFVDTLINYKHNAYDLGWIGNKGKIKSLDKKLENAQKQINKGNNKTACNILNAFLNELEALYKNHHITEKGGNGHGRSSPFITNEAYALLKYNTVYLVKQLEE
jgi:hypothetical protein